MDRITRKHRTVFPAHLKRALREYSVVYNLEEVGKLVLYGLLGFWVLAAFGIPEALSVFLR